MSIDLVACAWQTALLAAAVGLVQVGCGCWLSPGLRRALWLPVALRALLPVLPAASFSLWSWKGTVVSVATTGPAGITYGPVPAVDAVATLPAAGVAAPAAAAPFPWMMVIIATWLLGVVVMALLSWRRGRIRCLAADPTTLRPDLPTLVRVCADLLGLRRAPRLRLVEDGHCPGLGGIIRPTVYLPVTLLREASDRELEAVLLHEFAHRRRRDQLWGGLAFLVRLAHWFNPLVWWAAARDRRDAELACDAAVAAALAPERRMGYAHGLLSAVARLRGAGRGPAVAMSAANLRRRLVAIRDWRRPPRWHAILVMVLVLGLGACGLTRPTDAVADPVAEQPGVTVIDGEGEPVLRIYDVQDLLAGIPDFPAPPPDSREPARKPEPALPTHTVKGLTTILRNAAADAALHVEQMGEATLAIRAHPETHLRLKSVLAALRRGRSEMVQVRCRILRVTRMADLILESQKAVASPEGVQVMSLTAKQLDRLVAQDVVEVVRNASLAMLNGQRAHYACIEQQSYVSRLDEKGQPVTEVVSPGDVVELKPIISADRRYVTLEVDARLSRLLCWRRKHLVRADGEQVPVMDPELATRRLRSTTTLPDGGALLLAGFTPRPAEGDPGLFLVLQAEVIRFEQVEVETGL